MSSTKEVEDLMDAEISASAAAGVVLSSASFDVSFANTALDALQASIAGNASGSSPFQGNATLVPPAMTAQITPNTTGLPITYDRLISMTMEQINACSQDQLTTLVTTSETMMFQRTNTSNKMRKNLDDPTCLQALVSSNRELGKLEVINAFLMTALCTLFPPKPSDNNQTIPIASGSNVNVSGSAKTQSKRAAGTELNATNKVAVMDDGFKLVVNKKKKPQVKDSGSTKDVPQGKVAQVQNLTTGQAGVSHESGRNGAGSSAPNTGKTVPKKVKRPPPITFTPPNNWHLHLIHIRENAPSTYSKPAGGKLRLTVDTPEEYRSVLHYLGSQKIPHHTYQLDSEKPFKVVVRGLPANTNPNGIKLQLEDEQFVDVKVFQMSKGPKTNKHLMPLFYVQVAKTPDVARIYKLPELLGTEVTIEKYKGMKGPSQCHRCQGFFHSAAACFLEPRCVRCGQAHLTAECSDTHKKPEDPCKCCNCGGQHPASYRNCPKFPKQRNPPKKGRKAQRQAPPTVRVVQPTNQFVSRRTDPTVNYSQVTKVSREQPKTSLQHKTAPSQESPSSDDFMKYLLLLEEKYPSNQVYGGFKHVLDILEAESSPLRRVFLLYEAVHNYQQ